MCRVTKRKEEYNSNLESVNPIKTKDRQFFEIFIKHKFDYDIIL